MRFRRSLLLFAICCVLFALINLTACEKDEPEPPPAITSFSPEKGFEGATVHISGEHFSEKAANNIVTFSGTPANVTSATTTTLTVSVPQGATFGKVSVTTSRGEATSANDFTVLFPSTITSFTPLAAGAGASVTISGTNFSPTASENIVK